MAERIWEDEDFKTWLMLGRTRDALIRSRAKDLLVHGLTTRQSTILIVLEKLGDKATPAEISRWAFREAHTISDFLKRMERDGLIRRVKDLKRKNMIRVEITEKGHEAVHNAVKMESIHRIMPVLTEEEHRQLRALLEKLWNKSLEELRIQPKPMFPSFPMPTGEVR